MIYTFMQLIITFQHTVIHAVERIVHHDIKGRKDRRDQQEYAWTHFPILPVKIESEMICLFKEI